MTMPSCSYRDERIIGIGLSAACENVVYNGVDLFATSPRDAIRHLVACNGGTVRFGADTFIFDALAMTAGDFFFAKRRRYFDTKFARARGESDDRGITFEPFPDPRWDAETFPILDMDTPEHR